MIQGVFYSFPIMAGLISLRSVSLGFGGPPVLDGIDLRIEAGERLCLLGRNGEGKSTLLKLVAGELQPEDGEIHRQRGLRIASLAQEAPAELTCTVYDVVAGGLGEVGELLSRHQHLSQDIAGGRADLLKALNSVQQALEAAGGWRLGQRVETMLTRFGLEAAAGFSQLSGGLKRRALLARALISEPDLLLLDEPTNHLDIDAIRWLEDFLLTYRGALFFITHDRALIKRLATRIVELDRGQLTSWPGNYGKYLERKQAALEAEAARDALFDKKLAQEERWIRQGIKARRTRNEGRVRALKALREQRGQRRTRAGSARLRLDEGELSGKLVLEAEGVSAGHDDRLIIRDFSTLILRGDKIGIIGPNGSGKTTLIDLLLGRLAPWQGRIRMGTKLKIAYFDQHRAQLQEERSIIDNVADGSDRVTVNGQPRHVISYLQDFLFSPQRARTPAGALSGGERNRLLLAKLFARPSNLLVMDEPTNDLDIETLELLEERLVAYKGTLLLVSHDRDFIDNVVTSTLVLEGNGRVAEYVGGYQDWLRQRPLDSPGKTPAKREAGTKPGSRVRQRRKLGYKEQRELEALPAAIERMEQEVERLQREMARPAFYQRGAGAITEDKKRLSTLEHELAAAYERWEFLERIREETQAE